MVSNLSSSFRFLVNDDSSERTKRTETEGREKQLLNGRLNSTACSLTAVPRGIQFTVTSPAAGFRDPAGKNGFFRFLDPVPEHRHSSVSYFYRDDGIPAIRPLRIVSFETICGLSIATEIFPSSPSRRMIIIATRDDPFNSVSR